MKKHFLVLLVSVFYFHETLTQFNAKANELSYTVKKENLLAELVSLREE